MSLWRVDDAEEAMYKSYEVSSGITITTTFFVAWLYAGQLSLATLVAVGVALAVAFNPLTSYATSAKSGRVQTIAAATRFGPASVILEGLSLGYLSSVWALFVIVGSLTASILVYSFDFPDEYELIAVLIGVGLSVIQIVRGQLKGHLVEGFFQALWIMVIALFVVSCQEVPDVHRYSYILFGVSLIGVGMLSHTGNNVSMDTFGPISDNANGIGEIAGMGRSTPDHGGPGRGREHHQATKGVAIGSAVIAAVSLFGSFFTDIKRVWPEGKPFEEVINLADPVVFVGLLIGDRCRFVQRPAHQGCESRGRVDHGRGSPPASHSGDRERDQGARLRQAVTISTQSRN